MNHTFNTGDRVTYPGRGNGAFVVSFKDSDLPGYVLFDSEEYPRAVDSEYISPAVLREKLGLQK
jgi:hypothetical protein